MALIEPFVHAATQLVDVGQRAPQALSRTEALTLDHHVFGDHGVDDHVDVVLAALATLARSLGPLGVGLTDHEHLLAGIHLGQALLDEPERLGGLLRIIRVHLMRSEAVLHVVALMAELVLVLRCDTDMRRLLTGTSRPPVLPDLEVRRLSSIVRLVVATLALAHLALLAVLLSEVEEVRDRKSTRLNSSHVAISYAVFCLKK